MAPRPSPLCGRVGRVRGLLASTLSISSSWHTSSQRRAETPWRDNHGPSQLYLLLLPLVEYKKGHVFANNTRLTFVNTLEQSFHSNINQYAFQHIFVKVFGQQDTLFECLWRQTSCL
ncbi:hypothetical protein E4T43_09082 [Aureobasidium subglaciale]|nr:hypothetical protein E4T43_09082 [Aureobasidium subglaciale]